MSSISSELKNEIVRAGAGAGKTTRLTQKVIAIAQEYKQKNGNWPRLVVTTFTRKATQELRERLIIQACKSGNSELIQYVSSKNMLFISTIHGVFGKFLRDYGQLFDLDPNYKIVSDKENQRIARKILKSIIIDEPANLEMLENFSFKEILEMSRVYFRKLLEFGELYVATERDFDALLKKRLGQVSQSLVQKIDTIIDDIDPEEEWHKSLQSLKVLAKSWTNEDYDIESWFSQPLKLPRITGKGIQGVKESLKEIKSYVKDSVEKLVAHPGYIPSNWSQFIQRGRLLEQIFKKFSVAFLQEKLQTAKLEMSDVELISLYYLRKEPLIGGAFSSDWNFWLIDEYQDTSPLQVEILNLLIGSSSSYIVGDPQQSIYLFRGARSEVFNQKENSIQSSGGLVSSLQRNWRSDPELLLFFNFLFSQVGEQFIAMEPKSEELDPDKIIATIINSKKLEGNSRAEKELSETDSIVSYIEMKALKGASLEQICILGRTNKVLEELVGPLEKKGIPVNVHSASGFYRRREIQDLLALLKFLLNPHDNLNFLTLVRSPWFRIDDRSLSLGLEDQQGVSHWNHLRKKFADSSQIEQLYEAMKLARKMGVSNALEELMVNSNFYNSSTVYDSTGRRESNIWKFLTRLKKEERKPGFSYFEFLSEASSSISEDGSDNEGDAIAALEPNRVNLMTVHSSKGLQFDHVILPRMGRRRGSPPGAPLLSIDEEGRTFSVSLAFEEVKKYSIHGVEQQQKTKEREDQENERLFYVALTRAKKSICMSWCGKPSIGSWAEMVRISLEEGIHKTNQFSYFCTSQIDRSVSDSSLKTEPVVCLKEDLSPLQWEQFVRLEEERISVTKILGGYKSQGESPLDFSLNRDLGDFEAELNGSDIGHDLKVDSEFSPIDEVNVITRGMYLHKVFEILKYHPNYNFEDLIQKWFGQKDKEILQAIDFVKKVKEVPLMSLFQNGEVEWAFQMPSKRGIVEGQIDLWGTDMADGKEVVWIVDYKSGSDRYSDRAFRQLDLYSLAIREIYPEHLIKLAVVYPLTQKTIVKNSEVAESIRKQFDL